MHHEVPGGRQGVRTRRHVCATVEFALHRWILRQFSLCGCRERPGGALLLRVWARGKLEQYFNGLVPPVEAHHLSQLQLLEHAKVRPRGDDTGMVDFKRRLSKPAACDEETHDACMRLVIRPHLKEFCIAEKEVPDNVHKVVEENGVVRQPILNHSFCESARVNSASCTPCGEP